MQHIFILVTKLPYNVGLLFYFFVIFYKVKLSLTIMHMGWKVKSCEFNGLFYYFIDFYIFEKLF